MSESYGHVSADMELCSKIISGCDYTKFKPTYIHNSGIIHKGYVQPFLTEPLNNPNNPAEFSYMQMINTARRYIYITTPYLILDNEMVTSLRLAAQSGIDVRIITPGIPDKKYVFAVTRTFYGVLLETGVKIYEYVPGFIHSKNVVCDDETAIVGTINMDFRSFICILKTVYGCVVPIPCLI